jgi:hypothetical protein
MSINQIFSYDVRSLHCIIKVKKIGCGENLNFSEILVCLLYVQLLDPIIFVNNAKYALEVRVFSVFKFRVRTMVSTRTGRNM